MLLCDTEEKLKVLTKGDALKSNVEKIYLMGTAPNGMLTSYAGLQNLGEEITEVLGPKVVEESWTPRQCAEETHNILRDHSFTAEDLVKFGLPEGYDTSGWTCDFFFGQYIGEEGKKVGSLYFANKNDFHEIFDIKHFEAEGSCQQLFDQENMYTFTCAGGGMERASDIIAEYCFFPTPAGLVERRTPNIDSGLLSKDEHSFLLLCTMKGAMESVTTGGVIRGWHMSPDGMVSELFPPVLEAEIDQELTKLASNISPMVVYLDVLRQRREQDKEEDDD